MSLKAQQAKTALVYAALDTMISRAIAGLPIQLAMRHVAVPWCKECNCFECQRERALREHGAECEAAAIAC